jgi:hypothetical protein
MFKQVLEQEYIRSRMRLLASDAAPPTGDLPDGDGPTPEELEEIRRRLAEVAAQEPDPHLDEEHPAPEGPDGEPIPPLADTAYFSRDKLTSLVQSALEAYVEEREPELAAKRPEPRGEGLAPGEEALPDPVTDRSLNVAEGRAELFGAFEITDPGWVNSLVAMAWRRLHDRHAFKEAPAAPQSLAADARIVLVADWGSGIPRARNVAAQIRKIIEPDIGRRQQHVIHLGDVYYSGWKREYDKNFLEPWPVQDGEPVGSWSCNGNHDMYSGGHAYFGHMLGDPRFAAQQGSSWFSLENDDWQLLALDTAYEDHALRDPQGAWVADKLRRNAGRRTMLLSHHQLFSAYASDGPKIREKLTEPLRSGRIDAWFWGHEHRCVFYEDGHEGVGKARLIGHGGVPVYAHHEPLTPPATYQFTTSFPTAWEEWALMGFAVVELSGRDADVRYVDEFGNVYAEEVLASPAPV